jgi:5-formyltetrahydrofolate cyclo-ligase
MSGDTAMTERKRWLRSEYRRRRRLLPPLDKQMESSATASVCIRILDALADGAAWPPVASYMATNEELDLGELHAEVWRRSSPVWLPRIQGPGRLSWYPIRSMDEVRIGTLNLCEPDPSLVAASELPPDAILFVPGVAFGPDGSRLGMGGGYYDRLLAEFHGVSVGVGFANQTCEDLPSEAHDHPVSIAVLGGDLEHCAAPLRPRLGLA